MNPVNWFEIPVSDLDRATAFYQNVLDLEITRQEMGPALMGWFPIDQEGTGSTESLMKSEGFTPSHEGSLVYFSVEDLDATLAKIEAAGGRTIMPRMGIGEFGFIAHFEDCEGNRVALHSAT